MSSNDGAMTAIASGCDWRSPWSASRPMVNRMPSLWAIRTEPIKTPNSLNSGRFWLTPPEVEAMIEQEFGKFWDACPHPLPDGHDALAMDWPKDEDVIYVNAPFTKKDELHGQGLIAFARRVVAEHGKGKTVIMVMPIRSSTNTLLAAGAEVRPLGRTAWLDVETGKPWPSPGYSALFILRAKKHRR